jgi:hypothetical protein
MSLPLVSPLPADSNDEVAQLVTFFIETLGFCPNSFLAMQHQPAIAMAFIQLNKAVMASLNGQLLNSLSTLLSWKISASTGPMMK